MANESDLDKNAVKLWAGVGVTALVCVCIGMAIGRPKWADKAFAKLKSNKKPESTKKA